MAEKTQNGIRWDRIEEVRARLASGFYDDPDIQSDLIERSLDQLLDRLQGIPVGDGDEYRDLVANVLAASLEEVVDVPMMRKEVAIDGGRADLELPIRIENIDKHAVWHSWHRRYRLRCMLVETKNMQSQAAHEDINQLKGYLQGGNRGHFGLIVSRSGFTKNAMKTLSATAKSGSYLILPFDNRELGDLLRMSKQEHENAMEFLRRKELFLLQAA